MAMRMGERFYLHQEGPSSPSCILLKILFIFYSYGGGGESSLLQPSDDRKRRRRALALRLYVKRIGIDPYPTINMARPRGLPEGLSSFFIINFFLLRIISTIIVLTKKDETPQRSRINVKRYEISKTIRLRNYNVRIRKKKKKTNKRKRRWTAQCMCVCDV